jgi:tetrahydromethanopterin S-methyltransferase subunit G
MERDIAREQGAIAARQDALDKRLTSMEDKLDEVVQFVHETRGGKKVFFVIASAFGFVIGQAVDLFRFWKSG